VKKWYGKYGAAEKRMAVIKYAEEGSKREREKELERKKIRGELKLLGAASDHVQLFKCKK
jgi:hypothetical protein